jgi:hypothetical protein
MPALPPHNQPPNPFTQMLAALGGGILGTFLFIGLVILFLPLVLIVLIYLAIVRWKMKRAMADMQQQMQQGLEGMFTQSSPGQDDPDNVDPRSGRKHVDVTVTTVENDRNEPA